MSIRKSFMSAWRLVAVRVMHCLAVKFRAVFRWMFTARRKTSMVALAIVEMMIDVSVEVIRPVVPRSRADENTARKPLRAIVTIWGTTIRRTFIVPYGQTGATPMLIPICATAL